MTTLQFIQSILDWLLADPAHIVTAASAVAALTPNPDPNSVAGKIYRIVDILALNILRAKTTVEAASAPATPIVTPAMNADRTKQSGFMRGAVPQLILVAVGVALLCGCSAAQNAFTQANTQVVQTAMGAGKDEMTVGRELICGAPYQVVANAMADDSRMGTAVPALCPATKSVTVPTPTVTPSP